MQEVNAHSFWKGSKLLWDRQWGNLLLLHVHKGKTDSINAEHIGEDFVGSWKWSQTWNLWEI